MLLHDWRGAGRITKASWIGAAFVFGPQLLQPLVVDSAAFASLTRMLTDLVYYR